MRTTNERWAAVAVAVMLPMGCVEPTSRPSASIVIEPSSICLGDGHETVVLLDGSTSAARLSLVPSAPDADVPLTFGWELSGDDYEIVGGDLEAQRLEITMKGERPLAVRLTVTNELGAEFDVLRSVGLTLDCP